MEVRDRIFYRKQSQSRSRQVSDIAMVFPDGEIFIDRSLLLAVIGLRLQAPVSECDSIFMLEFLLSSGQHLSKLLSTGETELMSRNECNQLQTLIALLDLSISYQLESPLSNISFDQEIQVAKIGNEHQDERVNENVIEENVINDLKTSILKSKKMNKKLFECDLCYAEGESLFFESLTKFRKHTVEVHNVKPLKCPESSSGCQFRADDVSKLATHVQGVHKTVFPNKVSCHICLKSFTSSTYLNSHIKRMHKLDSEQRKKICPYCGEAKLQLNDHIMRSHKVKKYFCRLCPKSFKTNVQLRIHNNVHTGFRPYTCATCDQRFARLHHRKVHLTKYGHAPGPVLKPPDHVDQRSVNNKTSVLISNDENKIDIETETVVISLPDQGSSPSNFLGVDNISHEQLKQEIGVNCAEIIKNITLSAEDLEFD